jgi:SAM-dependent methyltransferase
VDYLAEEVQRMRAEGFDAVCANVEEMDLGEEFNVIVAGDIIEHLDNPGKFLGRAGKHLKPDGILLVTTPNPITYVRMLRVLLKGHAGANREHTCWFTAKVLRQLAGRHELRVVEEAFVDDTRLFYPWLKPVPGKSAVRRFLRHLNRVLGMLLIWKPAVLLQSILCRFRPKLSETVCLALRQEAK